MTATSYDPRNLPVHGLGAGPLAPPMRLEVGSIVTLRMRGHVRTQGLEYFAPAVVLNQHMPNGEIEVLVWDSSAGTHFNPAFQIRDLANRDEMVTERVEGTDTVATTLRRAMYEVQSNIGQVLFSPEAFARMAVDLEALQSDVRRMLLDVHELKAVVLENMLSKAPDIQQRSGAAAPVPEATALDTKAAKPPK